MIGSDIIDDIQAAIAAMQHAERIAITAHVRPDGDALGSSLGLRRLLAASGKSAAIVALDAVPKRYQFLMGDDTVIPASRTSPDAFDLLVILDTGSPDRANDAINDWIPAIRTLNIDHHPTNTQFADINVVNPDASSVGEMICQLSKLGDFRMTTQAAEALWVAMITDTGRFAYSNTHPATLEAAAHLLQSDIRTDRIDDQLYNTATLPQLRLQGRAIEHLELHENDRVALVWLSRDDFSELGCTGEDADEIVNIPRRVASAEVAVFLYELEDDGAPSTKASFRTHEAFDAAALCRELGGGGHKRAAGCTLAMPVDKARDYMVRHLHDAWFTIK